MSTGREATVTTLMRIHSETLARRTREELHTVRSSSSSIGSSDRRGNVDEIGHGHSILDASTTQLTVIVSKATRS